MARCRRTATTTVAAAGAVLAVSAGLLAGCTDGGDTPREQAAGSQAPVLVPDHPGEPNRTASPGERVPAPRANDADVEFVRLMIPHHEQALEMAGLAPQRASDQRVRGVASRIEAAQQPEIAVMRAWLRRQGLPEGGHDHERAGASMPGMATPAQLAALRDARGAAFDRLFVRLMIVHHRGALTMASKVLSRGADLTVQQLANEVLATQNAEIRRMEAMGTG